MATFLSLCIDLARESGTLGAAPTAVTGQVGRQAKVVAWVQQAWMLVQNARSYWKWLRASFEGTLTPGSMSYAAASLNAPRFREWLQDYRAERGWYRSFTMYDPSIGAKDERELVQISYEQWRTSYCRGVHDPMRPQYWAIAPDGSLVVGPVPDKAYVLRGEYWKTPQPLVGNEDIPELPLRFHDIIWQRAMLLLTGKDEAGPAAYQEAKLLFDETFTALCKDQLPEVTIAGGPIA